MTRSILGAFANHKIKKESVSSQVYLGELEKLRIIAKFKNFLVSQGSVESTAKKNSNEQTTLFEEISDSGLLKKCKCKAAEEMQKKT